ncbi:hypothetical protein [Candidatus Mesenet endosymbiont of Phosphuga atrata]
MKSLSLKMVSEQADAALITIRDPSQPQRRKGINGNERGNSDLATINSH